jgi:hypothetical protein
MGERKGRKYFRCAPLEFLIIIGLILGGNVDVNVLVGLGEKNKHF